MDIRERNIIPESGVLTPRGTANPGAPPPRDRKRPSPSAARVPSDSFTPASLTGLPSSPTQHCWAASELNAHKYLAKVLRGKKAQWAQSRRDFPLLVKVAILGALVFFRLEKSPSRVIRLAPRFSDLCREGSGVG